MVTWQQLSALDQTQTVRTPPFHQRDPVVSQSPQIHVNRRRFGTRGALQTYRDVDPASKRSRNGSRTESQRAEQLGKASGEVDSGPFFCHDNARAHAGKVHAPRLELIDGRAESLGAQLHDAVRAEGVADFVLADRSQPEAWVDFHFRWRYEN